MLNFLINTVYAADTTPPIIKNIVTQIFNPIIGILFGASFIMFLYGVVEYIQAADDEKAVEKGRLHIIYGIVGLVIIVGVNGLIVLITSTVSSIGS